MPPFPHICLHVLPDNGWTHAARARGAAVQTDVSTPANFIDRTEIAELLLGSLPSTLY